MQDENEKTAEPSIQRNPPFVKQNGGFLKFMDSCKRIRGLCRMLKAWAETEEKKDHLKESSIGETGQPSFGARESFSCFPFCLLVTNARKQTDVTAAPMAIAATICTATSPSRAAAVPRSSTNASIAR